MNFGHKVRALPKTTIVAAICIACIACTRGKVRDHATGDGVNGASVEIFDWEAISSGSSYVWPARTTSPPADFTHTTQTYTVEGESYGPGFFVFDYDGSCIDGVKDDILGSQRWYRVRVEKDGYYTGFFYRYHDGYDDCNAYDCDNGQWEAKDDHCEDLGNFDINSESTTHRRRPDMFVDREELEDHRFQCVILPDQDIPANLDPDAPLGQKKVNLVALRAGLGTANVGEWRLHMRGYYLDSDPNTDPSVRHVLQEVQPQGPNQTDFAYPTEPLPHALFEFHEAHNHLHAQDWGALRIIDHTTDCLGPNRDDQTCIRRESSKLSFCALDSEKFDQEVVDEYSAVGLPSFPSGGSDECQQTETTVKPPPQDLEPCSVDADCPSTPGGSYCEPSDVVGGQDFCVYLCSAQSECPDGMFCDNPSSPAGVCRYSALKQGVTAGFEDVYGPEITGQYVRVGNPAGTTSFQMLAPGDYYLEGSWDSSGVFTYERSNSNNRAQAEVTIPSFNSDPSQSNCDDGDPATVDVVDCVANPGQRSCVEEYLSTDGGQPCPEGFGAAPDDGVCWLKCGQSGQSCPSNMQCHPGGLCKIPCQSHSDCPGTHLTCNGANGWCEEDPSAF